MSALTALAKDAHRAPGDLASRLPLAVVPGLVLMAVALGADVAAHAGVLASLEAPAHLLGVFGMVLTWIAVVVGGIRRSSGPR